MIALSVKQPWAAAIVLGLKDVENRTWSTRHRGPLLIHASGNYDRDGKVWLRWKFPQVWERVRAAYPEGLPRRAVVGRVLLVGVVRDSGSPWAEAGQYHWLLAEAERFAEPIPYPGQRGLFGAPAPHEVHYQGPTKVVNMKIEPCDVRIDRNTKWGNPFKPGPDGTTEEVLAKYEAWVRSRPELMAALGELKGKRLGCWCKPGPCHGDVLVRLLEEA